jgi:hypothetical protein
LDTKWDLNETLFSVAILNPTLRRLRMDLSLPDLESFANRELLQSYRVAPVSESLKLRNNAARSLYSVNEGDQKRLS